MRAPWLARAILCAFVPGDRREDLLGDLDEMHTRRRSRWGPARAGVATLAEALAVGVSFLVIRAGGLRRASTGGNALADLKHAFRTLSRTPFITAVAVVSLALGIGANAAIFSLFDQMLLSGLPVSKPEELVNLSAPGPKPGYEYCGTAGSCEVVFSYPMFRDLEKAQTTLTGLAAHFPFGANLAFEGETVSGRGELVSGSYFPVLGLKPALGRLFGPEDDAKVGEPAAAVLSYGYWQTHLGGDPSVLNRTLIVDGAPFTVIGVAPRGFQGTTMGAPPDVYVPATMSGTIMFPEIFGMRNYYWEYLFGRVKPGVTLAGSSAELNTLYHGIVNDVEAPLQKDMSAQTMARFRAKKVTVEDGRRGQSTLRADAQTPLTLLFAITVAVLLIACANIANLLLARGAGRAQEMSIRGSLGASRGQLLGQLLTESVFLAFLGGAVSLLVARWTLHLIGAILPAEYVATTSLALSPGVVLFTAVLSLGTGFLFGMYPALHSTRTDLITALRSTQGPSGARAATRFRTSLVTAQIALSMSLLVAAGLFIKSLTNITHVDLGLNAQNLVMFQISPERNGYEPEHSRELFQQAEQQLAAIPGVTAVTCGVVPLLDGFNLQRNISVQDFDRGPDVNSNSHYDVVGAGYFSTMGMPLVAGRGFTVSDADGAPKVAVVNEAFAWKFHLDGANAVGKFMADHAGANDLDIQIVGVVKDANYSEVKGAVPPVYFLPYMQNNRGRMTFYLRTAVPPSEVMAAARGVMKAIDGNLPLQDMKTLDQQVHENVALDRVISTLAAAFAFLATILAAVGLYGVLAYTVAQRTQEIGLRMALGAGARRVRGMVLGQVARMLVVGAVVGLGGAWAIGRAAESLLFEVKGHDGLVMMGGSVLLALVAFGAGYFPAMRASRVDPAGALRYE